MTDRSLLEKANELLQAGQAEQAIEILSAQFGPQHSYVAIGYNALAAQQYNKSEWNKARLSLKQAQLIWQEQKEDTSLELAACANNLGRVHEHLEEYTEAIVMHREALQLRLKALGDVHPETGLSMLSLGATLLSTGEFTEAQQMLLAALELFRAADMADSPEAGACQANLIICEKAIS